MMSKHCAQVVHDAGGVYGLTERAQKTKDRELDRQKQVVVKKSKQIHNLQISASNYKIAKDKWKKAFVDQKEKSKARLVQATARLRTKYAARAAQYQAKCKDLSRGISRVQSRGLWDARTPLMHSIPYSMRKQIAIEHVNNRISMKGKFTNLSMNYGPNLLTNFGISANKTPAFLAQVGHLPSLSLM
jgi:hypothetical protein